MRKLSLVTIALLSLVFSGCSEAGAITSKEGAIEAITKHFGGLKEAADSVTDEATAKTANTTITDIVGKLGPVMKAAKALPTGSADVLSKVKELAGPIMTKLTGLAGPLKGHMSGAIEKLSALIK